MLEALLLSVIVGLAAWFVIQRKRRLSFFKDLGIPGPPPSFISGNLSEVIRKGALVTFKEWLEKYGDIVGFYNGAHPFIIVKDLELIKKVQINDFNNFTSRGMMSGFARTHPILTQSVTHAEGDHWKKMRSLITPAFTTSNMKKMMSHMDDTTNEFFDIIETLRPKHKAIEFRQLFQRLAADVIIRSAFGLKSNLQQKGRTNSTTESLFQDSLASFQQFRRAWINFLTACFPEFTPLWTMVISYSSGLSKTATDRMCDEISAVVEFRRGNHEKDRSDLLQLMLNAEVEDEAPIDMHLLTTSVDADSTYTESQPAKVNSRKKSFLTNMEVMANCISFFVAGFETTATALAYTAYLLARHPNIQGRLREEVMGVLKRDGIFTYDNVFSMKYMEQVISESLRFYAPVTGFATRGCAADYVYEGISIPAGTTILIPNYHMHHDLAFWKQPEMFDPERFSPENKGQGDLAAYQPFGQGPRMCVGIRFAQLEMRLTLAKLMAKYKLVLDDRHLKEKELKVESTFFLTYPKNGIWLKLEKI
ncbi:cytochrome P450 3A12-like isoform X2 [Dermacentor andersoni]|uniref:cytochrome P450 3A12-like isoform X2 n=1 Tax=Dermacentor andersoni TaxID=34620 RepID=UPI0021553931|nr:cytochrome P450 3A12-like isoform X2 [Dermacentor andersoni]